MDGPPLPAPAHGLDRQALQTPGERPIEQRIQRHLAALHGTFDPMPAPAQMDHVGQRGAGQASLVVDELASKHGRSTMPIKYAVPAGSVRARVLTALAARYTGCTLRAWAVWDGLDTHPASQNSGRFGYSLGKTRNILGDGLKRSISSANRFLCSYFRPVHSINFPY